MIQRQLLLLWKFGVDWWTLKIPARRAERDGKERLQKARPESASCETKTDQLTVSRKSQSQESPEIFAAVVFLKILSLSEQFIR